MTESLPLLSAFIIGLLGSVHCIGMCGGISSALSLSIPVGPQFRLRQTAILFSYQVGRISSYAIAGLLVGGALSLTSMTQSELAWLPRTVAGVFMILMGLYLSGIWQGLLKLEAAGKLLWQYLEPIGKNLLPVKSPFKALLLGAIWGWLPCGLVYSTLTLAATQNNALQSAGIMICFGLGTLPSVMSMGYLSQHLSQLKANKHIPFLSGVLVIAFGVWTLPIPWSKLF